MADESKSKRRASPVSGWEGSGTGCGAAHARRQRREVRHRLSRRWRDPRTRPTARGLPHAGVLDLVAVLGAHHELRAVEADQLLVQGLALVGAVALVAVEAADDAAVADVD